jgi:DNA topoisomerase-3
MAGVMTYPRTDSQFIGENDYKQLPALLNVIKDWGGEYAAAIGKLPSTLSKASVNDSKVTGHHALMPTKDATAAKIETLSEVDRSVLALVARQTIMAVGEVCKKDSTSVKGQVLNVQNQEVKNEFKASGSVITYPGWRGLFKENPDPDKKQENTKFPALTEGEVLPIATITRLDKQPEPPKLFTEATLIAYMKNCGKDVDDKQLRDILNNQVEGIGRPATRPGIIKELVEQNHYLAIEKKKIIPTELGLYVYEITKGMDIASVELTAKWEQQLDKVAEGTLSHKEFMDYSKAQVSSLLSALQAKNITQPAPEGNGSENAPKCPKCGRPTRVWAMGISCTGNSKDKEKQACDFILWRKQYGKELTDSQLNSLLAKGKTGSMKFTSKTSGKPYDAFLTFNKKELKVGMEFPKKKF